MIEKNKEELEISEKQINQKLWGEIKLQKFFEKIVQNFETSPKI